MLLSEQLREIINKSELSKYAIVRGSGVDKEILRRFLKRESGLSQQSIDNLCEYLNLELKIRGSFKGKRPRK